jgi:hypothetical protein
MIETAPAGDAPAAPGPAIGVYLLNQLEFRIAVKKR